MTLSGRKMLQYSAVIHPRQPIVRASKCHRTFMDHDEISSWGGTSVLSTEQFRMIPPAVAQDYHLENSWKCLTRAAQCPSLHLFYEG